MIASAYRLIPFDGARPLRHRLIEQSSTPTVTHATPDEDELRVARLARKREIAVARLGTNWIMHPAYRFNPRHSNDAEIWKKSPGILDPIRARAVAAGRI